MKKNTYTIPLALVFSLFFLWAISSNLLPTMIRNPQMLFLLKNRRKIPAVPGCKAIEGSCG